MSFESEVYSRSITFEILMMLIQTQTGKSDKQRICSLTCYEVGRYLLSGLGFLEQQTGYHSK